MGEKEAFLSVKPTSWEKVAIVSNTLVWTLASRTTPFFPTFALPASNCGFTRAITSLPGTSNVFKTGKMSFNEINDTSIVANSGKPSVKSIPVT